MCFGLKDRFSFSFFVDLGMSSLYLSLIIINTTSATFTSSPVNSEKKQHSGTKLSKEYQLSCQASLDFHLFFLFLFCFPKQNSS